MIKKAHILVVDDEPAIRELLQEILEEEGYEVSLAENGEAARKARRNRRPDLILLDIWMPDIDGISLLSEWEKAGLDCPVLVMSGHGTVETAVEATKLGAYDFIEKPLSMAKLLLTVKHALEKYKLRTENAEFRQKAPPLAEPIGSSLIIQQLKEQAWKVAQHNAWVLLHGEFGTGKQTVARYIHAKSARRSWPFIVLEAHNLTTEQAAITLFGLESENNVQYGLLEQANNGILYIDEVGSLDLDLQEHLLGALESQQFYRVNGQQTIDIDVRVIASSQYNLEEAVKQNYLREDFYHHLNVVSLEIPSLRQHIDDIPELLNYYVNWLVDNERQAFRQFSVAAQNRLKNYTWPGNLQELKNIVQRLLILGNDEVISAEEVSLVLEKNAMPTAESIVNLYLQLPLREAREQFEKAYLEQQLRQYGSNISELARRVGLERTHLYRKLRALGIDPKQVDKN